MKGDLLQEIGVRTLFTDSLRVRARGESLTCSMEALGDKLLVEALDPASQTCRPGESAATAATLVHAIALSTLIELKC